MHLAFEGYELASYGCVVVQRVWHQSISWQSDEAFWTILSFTGFTSSDDAVRYVQ